MRKIGYSMSLTIIFFSFIQITLYAQSTAGLALSLDGDGDYGNFLFNAITTNTFTIEAWALISGPGGGQDSDNMVFSQRDDNTAVGSSTVSLLSESISTNGETRIAIRSSNGQLDVVDFTRPDYGEWHYYAAVTDSLTHYLYIDGVLVDTITNMQTGNYTTSIDHRSIGKHSYSGGDNAFFNGLIDEIRVWDHARTPEQIQANITDTLGLEYYSTADSGLVAYWRFDELEDLGINSDGLDDIRDYSVNGNHLDLEGDAILASSGALVGIENNKTRIPNRPFLSQNYPNPFNPTTNISYYLLHSERIEISIYNNLGQKIETLYSGYQTPGNHNLQFDASDLSSGIYYYQLKSKQFSDIKKCIIIK